VKLIYEVFPTVFNIRHNSPLLKSYDRGDFDSLVDSVIYNHYEDEFDKNNSYLEMETIDAMRESLFDGEYEDIDRKIEEYVGEILDFINGFDDKFIIDYEVQDTRYIAALPKEEQEYVEDFFNDMGVHYSINPDINKEVEGLADEVEADFRDAAEYVKDPLGYYGMSQSDFL
jgi:hypothetical protein